MRAIQHKAEAYWFYRVVSVGYDRWINPLFWTEPRFSNRDADTPADGGRIRCTRASRVFFLYPVRVTEARLSNMSTSTPASNSPARFTWSGKPTDPCTGAVNGLPGRSGT